MYLFGLLNTAGVFLCVCFLPGELNETLTDEEQAGIEEEVEEELKSKKNDRIQITWGSVIRSKSVMMAIIACFIGTVNLQFWTGYLATIFADPYGIEESTFGYIIASQTVAYVIGALVMPYTCEHLPRKFLFQIAMLGFGVCMIFLGPS